MCGRCDVVAVMLRFFFFFNDTATTEIYTLHIVGSVRCVQETGQTMDTGNKVSTRLSKIARDLNVGITTIVEFLNKQGIKMTPDPNAKIDAEAQMLLEKQFRKDHEAKVEADMHRPGRLKRDTITIEDAHQNDPKVPVEDFEDDSVIITDNSLHHSNEIKRHEPQIKAAKPEIIHTTLPEKPSIKVVGSPCTLR
eukprot:TRINITY_DN17351_c0_g1_i3.p1 TRINITY_DN17351_c0_g1~~TRINITY_DN17351_c0_g1_i3.p1  ORF type:complete len:194 (+),score=30.23 TRINITY_DN17351_c0_g1_i3:76-657(+)